MTPGRHRLRRCFHAALALLAIATACGPALAGEMRVTGSSPAAQATMTGRQTEFFVRFDRPVDHASSRLEVLRDGQIVQTLHPRLRSRPDTLYSGVRTLDPGDYELRWSVRSMRDRDMSDGSIPFSVRPPG
jgi:methionine-rich copper-binding protein CopC